MFCDTGVPQSDVGMEILRSLQDFWNSLENLQETDILQGSLMKAIFLSILLSLVTKQYTGRKRKYQAAFNAYKIILNY